MISREPEILIVDDVEVAANDFAALIKANLRFNVIAVSTSVEAIEVVKKHNIRVVVLDQVMPGKKGTDLYKEIKNINPSIKAIMLTGEASSDEVGLAMRLGFSNYLNKGEILKLPEIVLSLYIQYEIDILKKYSLEKSVLLYRDWKQLFSIKYLLINVFPINGDIIREEEKEVVLDIVVGQDIEDAKRYKYEDTIKLESSLESKLQAEMNLSAVGIREMKSKINSELVSKYSKSYTFASEYVKESQQKFRLPEQPVNPDVKYILRRVIERSPVYKEFRVIIARQCLLCKDVKIYTTVVSKQTNQFTSKQIDYFSDNTHVVTNLGIHGVYEN